MKKKFLFPLAGMALLVGVALCSPPPRAQADISPFFAAGNLQAAATSATCTAANTNIAGAAGACVQVQCPQGESTAVVNIANTAAITGTITVYTAADVNGTPGVFGTPLWSTTGGGTTNVQTITNSGKLYVTLGSDAWVEAVFTTATSGHGIGSITCSGAVARVGNINIPTALPSGQTGFDHLVCSGLAVCSPSNGPTPAVSVATPNPSFFATTGQSSPSPTGTASAVPCGTGATNCSAGVLTVTPGVNNSGNGEWIATVIDSSVVAAVTAAESVAPCVVVSPAPTVLDGNRTGSGQCFGTVAGALFGVPNFGNNTVNNPGLNANIIGHYIVPNSTATNVTCLVGTSTTGAIQVFTSCSVKLDPY